LQQEFPSILSSTLVVARRGKFVAEVTGEVHLDQGVRLVVYERLYLLREPIAIEDYGYEVWRGSEKEYWYDSQPHPGDLTLAPTHPHHKHIPPEIKHHRVPAPGMSFTKPNIPLLLREILAQLAHEST
jgi:hypothetical protein